MNKKLYLGIYLTSFIAALLLALSLIIGFLLTAKMENAKREFLLTTLISLAVLGLFQFGITSMVCVCLMLYKMWNSINDGEARTTPTKAIGFLFVPFFNFYWIFQVWGGFPADYNAYLDRYQLPAPQLSTGIYAAYPVLVLLSAFPIAGILIAVIGTFVFLAIISKTCDAVNLLEMAVQGRYQSADHALIQNQAMRTNLIKNKRKNMKKSLILMFAFFIVFAVGLNIASAQFTITIPNIPKIKKTKQNQPKQVDNQTTQNTTTTGNNQTNQTTTQTPQDEDKISNSGWLSYHVSEILKKRDEVDSYNPAERIYFVTATQENYLLFSVSKRARDYWLKDAETAAWRKAHPDNKLDAALDALAVSVAKRLPSYLPNDGLFKFRNPVAEKLVMESLAHTGTINAATVKVYKIGTDTAGWNIQKDDSGLPNYRYKYASVYFRDISEDDPFCHVVSVTVKQDYSGGGTFKTETYRSSADEKLFGCPAGK